MKRYNYREAVKSSIYDYINENKICLRIGKNASLEDLQDYESYLYDLVLNEDSVSGNLSGSYTCDTYQAIENLNYNFLLISEAFEYWEITESNEMRKYLDSPELMDVLIRMMYIREVVFEIVREINEN